MRPTEDCHIKVTNYFLVACTLFSVAAMFHQNLYQNLYVCYYFELNKNFQCPIKPKFLWVLGKQDSNSMSNHGNYNLIIL